MRLKYGSLPLKLKLDILLHWLTVFVFLVDHNIDKGLIQHHILNEVLLYLSTFFIVATHKNNNIGVQKANTAMHYHILWSSKASPAQYISSYLFTFLSLKCQTYIKKIFCSVINPNLSEKQQTLRSQRVSTGCLVWCTVALYSSFATCGSNLTAAQESFYKAAIKLYN